MQNRRYVLTNIGLVLALMFPLFAFNCNSTDTPYGIALKAALDITDSAKTGADTADALRKNGTITASEEKEVLEYLQQVNDIDLKVYVPCVQSAHAAAKTKDGFLACAKSLQSSLSDPKLLAEVKITRDDSQQKVIQISQALINLAQAAVSAIQATK